MMEIVNCQIESTMLGVEDHGIMSAWLYLKGDGWGQGFGGWALDGKPFGDTHVRQPHAACGAFVAGVLNALELTKWEDLPGKHVRIRREHSKVEAIGHIFKDKWFEPKEVLESL